MAKKNTYVKTDLDKKRYTHDRIIPIKIQFIVMSCNKVPHLLQSELIIVTPLGKIFQEILEHTHFHTIGQIFLSPSHNMDGSQANITSSVDLISVE